MFGFLSDMAGPRLESINESPYYNQTSRVITLIACNNCETAMISSLELAKLCGVSQGTVDRALHDRPGISEKTKAKILAMAEEHGYMANPAALEIMGKRNTMVGVLTPALNSPVLMQMVQSIQDVISTKGYRTFTSFFKNEEPFVDPLREFAARKAAGVIVFPSRPFPTLPDNLCKATKVISLMEPVNNEHAFFVSPDNHQIGHVCTEKLISLGHKNILMLNLNADRLTSRERQKGYEDAIGSKCPISHCARA